MKKTRMKKFVLLLVFLSAIMNVNADTFSEDWESGSISSDWVVSGTNQYRTELTTGYSPRGSYHLRMDDTRGDRTYSRNELTTAYDFTGASDITLSFYWKEYSDETHNCPTSWTGNANGDCVAFTCDGNTWYRIDSLSGGSTTYQYKNYNLTTHANYCSSIDSNFAIRFQHYDNYPLSYDGFFFDDIAISYEIANGTTPDSCSDTDGGNVITTFGTTSGYYNESYYSNNDYCVDSSNIREYYCSGNYETSSQQSCGTDGNFGPMYCIGNDVYLDYRDYSCAGGACSYNDTPQFQEDCDNYDYYGSNYCMNSTNVYKDLYDYSCSGGNCSSFTVIPEFVEFCDYGCTAGTCDTIPDSCNETDAGYDLYAQGMTFGYSGGIQYQDIDYCIDNSTVKEYYCSGNTEYETNYDCTWLNMTGCFNGACI